MERKSIPCASIKKFLRLTFKSRHHLICDWQEAYCPSKYFSGLLFNDPLLVSQAITDLTMYNVTHQVTISPLIDTRDIKTVKTVLQDFLKSIWRRRAVITEPPDEWDHNCAGFKDAWITTLQPAPAARGDRSPPLLSEEPSLIKGRSCFLCLIYIPGTLTLCTSVCL